MARRNKSSVVEDILEIAAKLPWWIGVVLALVIYVWLHHVASQPAASVPAEGGKVGNHVVSQAWIIVATYFQYIIPGVCLVGAGISAFKSYWRNSSHSHTLDPDGRTPKTAPNPDCPQCGAHMVKRTTKRGNNVGERFWGCSNYPVCKGTRSLT